VVQDSKSKDLILKLVNMLPAVVNAQIKTDGAKIAKSPAIQTLLTGKASDKNIKPVTGNIQVSDNFSVSLPAYSFTLIRLKTQ